MSKVAPTTVSAAWLDRRADEHDNLRAALDWFEAADETERALRLAGALQRFWIVRGHLAEGRRRLERLLAADARPTAARGKALNGAALLALNTGEPETARRRAEEALALHEQLGDRWGTARSAFVLGFPYADARNFATARDVFERSRDGFAALGDEHNVLIVSSNLSWIYRELGDTMRARELDEHNLQRARELGNESMVALSLAGLAMADLDAGDGPNALTKLREALELDRHLGDVRRTVDNLCQLSHVLAATGQPELAARLLAGAVSLHADIGATISPEFKRLNAETLVLVRDQIGQAATDEATAAAQGMTFDEAYALSLDVN